jgi:hypothetical protein
MNRLFGITVTLTIATLSATIAQADEKDPVAILDKAIKALGGKEKLEKATVASTKTSGKVLINGQDNPFTALAIFDGPMRFRSEFSGEFGGNDVKVINVVNGEKAWRKFNDEVKEIDNDALANERRTIYLQTLPGLLYPLKSDKFKLASAPEQKVKGSTALAIEVTPPEGKTFTLCFDKESGLPVKLIADVVGWNGEEYNQETYYSDFKDYEGVKKATKIATMRNGEPLIEAELTEFKILDKVPPDIFAEPK